MAAASDVDMDAKSPDASIQPPKAEASNDCQGPLQQHEPADGQKQVCQPHDCM